MESLADQSEMLHFLSRENKQLKQEITELKELNALNRDALRITNSSSQKDVHTVIDLLFQENTKLISINHKLQQELEAGRCQNLISEQITFASAQHEKYLIRELEGKIKKYRRQLTQTEDKIIEAQKNNNKIVEVIDLTKVAKEFQTSMAILQCQIDAQDSKITGLEDQKDELMKLNLILTKQIGELKSIMPCQTTNSNNQSISNRNVLDTTDKDISKFIRYQYKLNEGSCSEESDESESEEEQELECQSGESGFDDGQVQKSPSDEKDRHESSHLGNQEQITQINQKSSEGKQKNGKQEGCLKNMSEKENRTLPLALTKPKSFAVPKLELTKAKQIQNLIVKKINNDLKKKDDVKEEKYRKLELLLQEARRKYSEQLVELNQYRQQNQSLMKFINELEARNEILAEQKKTEAIINQYQKQKTENEDQNMETLVDICRDVTTNGRLKQIVKGSLVPELVDVKAQDI